MKQKVSNLKIIYSKTIKVVGVTFGNHPKNIQKIIANGLDYKLVKRYSGLKDKQLLKEQTDMKEFNYECLGDVILKPYKYNSEDAISVYINDFDDNYLKVGHIPKKEVSSLIPLFNHEMIIEAFLTGGNLKSILHSEKKDKIETEKLNIGISLDIIVKEK